VPLGLEFRANTYTTGVQARQALASDSAGNFVVLWDSNTQDGASYGIFGQRYDGSGAPLAAEFRVNTYTSSSQYGPAVAADGAGNLVVVWASWYQDGSMLGIFGQRYASSGAPVGPEFRVNTFTTGTQRLPSIASDPSGNFVVVWQSVGAGAPPGVFGQRYSSSGAPLGTEFQVNTYTTAYPYNLGQVPQVAADATGRFVVVWNTAVYPFADTDIALRRYDSFGAPLGPQFRVNTYTTDPQLNPAVAFDGSGNFVVVWFGGDGSGNGIFGQRYASSGAPDGPEFRVNTYTTNNQSSSAVASDPSGNFVVLWHSPQDGSGTGVYGQRYMGIFPVELTGFSVE
jgi:hypothetical protein